MGRTSASEEEEEEEEALRRSQGDLTNLETDRKHEPAGPYFIKREG